MSLIYTPKAVNANSYASVEFANTYFHTRLYSDNWDQAEIDDKEAALTMATFRFEREIQWNEEMIGGARTTLEQALLFPRIACLNREGDYFLDADTNPDWLMQAQCEQALFEVTSDRTADPATRGLKKAKADTVAVEFDGEASQSQYLIADVVWSLIRPWTVGGSNNKYNGLRAVPLART